MNVANNTKSFLKTASIIAASMGICILFFRLVLPMLIVLNSNQPSIGIIGGADGPTAQFITFNLIAPYMLEICFLLPVIFKYMYSNW